MTRARSYAFVALVAFVMSIAGVLIGRALGLPERPVENRLHDVLHRDLALDPAQRTRLEALERQFAVRRTMLERTLRDDNALLAAAIEAEHGYGPQVAAAVDRSHRVMGALQKETLEHVFAMRRVLQPDQATRFDAAVMKALTAKPQ